jgi:hypothetical protein
MFLNFNRRLSLAPSRHAKKVFKMIKRLFNKCKEFCTWFSSGSSIPLAERIFHWPPPGKETPVWPPPGKEALV